MDLQKYKTVIIMLEVDMGCNHMANLIATSPLLADRVEDSSVIYTDRLFNYYNKRVGNAHASPIVSDIDEIIKPTLRDIVTNSTLPFVIGGHLQSLYGMSGEEIKRIGRTLVLLGSAESVNESICLRSAKEFTDYFLENYKKTLVAKGANIPEEDIVEFDPNLLFSPDITKLLSDLNNEVGFDLDIELCQQLHTIWFNKITRNNNLKRKI